MKFRPFLFPLLATLLAPPALRGQDVSLLTQARRVEAFIHEEFGEFGDPRNVEDLRSDAAPGFDPFDAAVRAEGPQTGHSAISQHSALGAGAVTVSGAWDGWASTGDGYYRFDTLVATTFDVAGGPVRYDLAYHIDRPDILPGRMDVDLALRPTAGGAAVFDVEPVYEEQPPTSTYAAVGALTGQLAPGRYDFRFFQRIINDPGLDGAYAVTLRLSPLPEPGHLIMLAVPLLLLARARKPR